MTTKQKLKILSLIFTVLAVVGLFVPNLNDTKSGYSTFYLTTYNGFKFTMLLIIILAIVAISFNLMSISYDKNKYLPIVTLAAAFLCGILVIFTKQFSSPSGTIAKEYWIEDTKLGVGFYFLIIGSFLAFITNSIIVIRTFALGKNDDDYDDYIDEESEENEEIEELDEETKEAKEIFEEFQDKE